MAKRKKINFKNNSCKACYFKIKLYLCTRNQKKHNTNALLAQLVEQLTLNQWVQGSNP